MAKKRLVDEIESLVRSRINWDPDSEPPSDPCEVYKTLLRLVKAADSAWAAYGHLVLVWHKLPTLSELKLSYPACFGEFDEITFANWLLSGTSVLEVATRYTNLPKCRDPILDSIRRVRAISALRGCLLRDLLA